MNKELTKFLFLLFIFTFSFIGYQWANNYSTLKLFDNYKVKKVPKEKETGLVYYQKHFFKPISTIIGFIVLVIGLVLLIKKLFIKKSSGSGSSNNVEKAIENVEEIERLEQKENRERKSVQKDKVNDFLILLERMNIKFRKIYFDKVQNQKKNHGDVCKMISKRLGNFYDLKMTGNIVNEQAKEEKKKFIESNMRYFVFSFAIFERLEIFLYVLKTDRIKVFDKNFLKCFSFIKNVEEIRSTYLRIVPLAANLVFFVLRNDYISLEKKHLENILNEFYLEMQTSLNIADIEKLTLQPNSKAFSCPENYIRELKFECKEDLIEEYIKKVEEEKKSQESKANPKEKDENIIDNIDNENHSLNPSQQINISGSGIGGAASGNAAGTTTNATGNAGPGQQ